MKLITYATHEAGKFNELVNSADITVLGFGTKWNGFMDKFKGVLKYLETQPDDELVVFLDGFDSIINKDLKELEQTFVNKKCKVLVSRDGKCGYSDFIPDFVSKYFGEKVFGVPKDKIGANSGLYMGYCKYLKIMLNECINQDVEDDQLSLNLALKKFDFVKIDIDETIFENSSNEKYASNAFFVQFPGTLNPSRIFRAILEYSPFFLPDILFIMFVILIIVVIIKCIRKK